MEGVQPVNTPKAIEILSLSANTGVTTFDQDFKDAEKLGIEALKRHKNRASTTFAGMMEPLPGETSGVDDD